MADPDCPCLFVYGTLRAGAAHLRPPEAPDLTGKVRPLGVARTCGRLYRIAYYPGFVPGDGEVTGDLLLMEDPGTLLPLLDDYEECSPRFPQPHEYERRQIVVEANGRPLRAWAYVYNRPVAGLALIDSGDFLA